MRREPMTPQTVTDPKRLFASIIADREWGYSLVDREAEPHFRSIAVPVRRYDDVIIGAINIGSHVDRISTEEMIARFLPLDGADRQMLNDLMRPALRNWNGITVGALRPAAPLTSAS